MLSISGQSRIYLHLVPTDMRRSFRGLSALVYQYLSRPEDGAYYVFLNRARTLLKILYFDGDGLAIWYKRLERGQFVIPPVSGERVALERRQLSMLLEGVIPFKTTRRFKLEKKDENTSLAI